MELKRNLSVVRAEEEDVRRQIKDHRLIADAEAERCDRQIEMLKDEVQHARLDIAKLDVAIATSERRCVAAEEKLRLSYADSEKQSKKAHSTLVSKHDDLFRRV